MASRDIEDRQIREANPEEALQNTQEAIASAEARYGGPRKVIPPYYPRRPIPAGDPMSKSGAYVAEEELDDDLRDKVNAAGQLLEVVLTFPDTLAPGTAFNIQDGTYAGGGPAVVEGDRPDYPYIGAPGVTLPLTAQDFQDDGRISVILNGQELERGNGTGNGDAVWVSPTQLKITFKTIHTGNQVMVRAPQAPPAPPPIP